MCSRVHRHIIAGGLGHVYSPSEAIHILLSNTFAVLYAKKINCYALFLIDLLSCSSW